MRNMKNPINADEKRVQARRMNETEEEKLHYNLA